MKKDSPKTNKYLPYRSLWGDRITFECHFDRREDLFSWGRLWENPKPYCQMYGFYFDMLDLEDKNDNRGARMTCSPH